MGPVRLNRRRFLGCSAAAGLAITQGLPVEAASAPVRLGMVGLGNRGTALLRSLLELPGVDLKAVCDLEPKARLRAQGIAEKARGLYPEAIEDPRLLLERTDVDAVLVALPCDLHAGTYLDALQSGKHLYAEKPLGLTVSECDALIDESARRPDQVVHVGFQRRSNPRYREGIELIRSGELGTLIEARFTWSSSNGPMGGQGSWLSRRERSGDWMVEQAVHVWDVLNWIAGGPPSRAFGQGRRDLFAGESRDRDVTDHYSVLLQWPDGFSANFGQSWIDPPDSAFTGTRQLVVGTQGGIDFGSGVAIFRDRGRPRRPLHPGSIPDTRLALATFLDEVRSGDPASPPITLDEAREATQTALLVRRAVDERRLVTMGEITAVGG